MTFSLIKKDVRIGLNKMDKWFENKDKKNNKTYTNEVLEDTYEPEIDNTKRGMGLLWFFIFVGLTILIIILIIMGFGVAFIIVPFPLWLAWKSLKIYRRKE